ncbi:Dihydrodipicolinate synthase [Emticicia oligotrophica DSM 17448]|uniref:4-hydroxy-tetrahydrodipicolinate synthase n=1 Tax=Emticicia oligotrophica (strain DSM 17448 / CIP 109782 / MTCC 6937 / GPTSA100-15) TaxID=929562 RepID=A0ABM5N2Y3_EMTOG|nr:MULTISPECIES: 4-hydroxy-tetrahydrodipicolinate synthase [Emticicia]AFK03830.1 Dihydrodipicolinate synthase [Emticicia oligotrophica DSM 17448]
MEHPLKGVGVALITPFDQNHEIDYDGFRRLIDFTSDGGVDYLVVQGTTGETSTTTAQEKADLLKFAKEHNKKNLPIVYGLGGNNTKVVLETIKNTDLSGVTAILSVCPYYNKPSQAGLIAHFTAIADASPVPVLLYNVPGRTVTHIQIPTVLELAKHPNIIGIKDASSIENAIELSKRCPKDFLLLSGDDNLVTTSVSMGFSGVISVIANAFPKEFGEMTWAALNGDFKKAAAIQQRFVDFDTLLYVESNPVGIKKCCEIKGICSSEVRLPLVKASSELGVKLTKAMIAEGFWQ